MFQQLKNIYTIPTSIQCPHPAHCRLSSLRSLCLHSSSRNMAEKYLFRKNGAEFLTKRWITQQRGRFAQRQDLFAAGFLHTNISNCQEITMPMSAFLKKSKRNYPRWEPSDENQNFLSVVVFCQSVLNTTNGENFFSVGSHPTFYQENSPYKESAPHLPWESTRSDPASTDDKVSEHKRDRRDFAVINNQNINW